MATLLIKNFGVSIFYFGAGLGLSIYDEDDDGLSKIKKNSWINIFFNQFVTAPVVLCLLDAIFPPPQEKDIIDISWQTLMTIQLPIILLIQTVGFYWMHRLFHTKYFWWFHREHHIWVKPTPLAAEDCHPFEHAFVNMLPNLIGPFFFRWSYQWIFYWALIGTSSALLSHRSDTTLSDFHQIHHSHPKKNFGVTFIWDWVFGTLYEKPRKGTV